MVIEIENGRLRAVDRTGRMGLKHFQEFVGGDIQGIPILWEYEGARFIAYGNAEAAHLRPNVFLEDVGVVHGPMMILALDGDLTRAMTQAEADSFCLLAPSETGRSLPTRGFRS